ncbi:unnamed protein product [Brassica oleracea]
MSHSPSRSFPSSSTMESSAIVSFESLLPPEPPDPDLAMVFPMDSPVPLVPPDQSPVLRLKLTPYPRRGPSLMDLNPRPPPEPPDPPDRATLSKSKTPTSSSSNNYSISSSLW